MKKLLILVLALLWCNVSIAKEIKVYHKDENSISLTSGTLTSKRQRAIAAKHCAQHGKFAFAFYYNHRHGAPDENGVPTKLYHCSKNNLTVSPISGESRKWKNYDPAHNFAKEEKIEKYKTTCASLGFEWGTDKFADCTLKLMLSDKKNKETTNQTTTSSETKIDWGKVAEEFNPELSIHL